MAAAVTLPCSTGGRRKGVVRPGWAQKVSGRNCVVKIKEKFGWFAWLVGWAKYC
jgi:hypothetical protein